MQEFNLVVEKDSDTEWGFNIQFDRPHNILKEKLPLSSDAATRALDEAYSKGYAAEELGEELGDNAVVGTVRVSEDEETVEVEFDADSVDEVYG